MDRPAAAPRVSGKRLQSLSPPSVGWKPPHLKQYTQGPSLSPSLALPDSSGERVSDVNSESPVTARPTEHVCEVQSRSCTVTELLPSQARLAPSRGEFWSKPKEPHPHPTGTRRQMPFRLHNTFSEACFSFLSRCCNKPLQEHWAGFPGGACLGMGQGGRPRSLQMLYFLESRAHAEGLSLSCAMFSPVCPAGV